MDFWLLLLTGLGIGGFSCLAVQGGLLASLVSTQQSSQRSRVPSGTWRGRSSLVPTLYFLSAKLVVYTFLGFLLGLFGSRIAINDSVGIYLQLLVGLYMLSVGCFLLDVHPLFRYVIIQPPHFLTRILKKNTSSKNYFAPVLLGLLTVFIPCGTTLAIEALAIGSRNPLTGASIMFAFTLGTIPLFVGIGYVSSLLKRRKQVFTKVSASLIMVFAVITLNGFLNLVGSPYTLQTLYNSLPIEINLSGPTDQNSSLAQVVNGVQEYTIHVLANGYSPNHISAKAGLPVKLHLLSEQNVGCTTVFRIPSRSIAQTLIPGADNTIEFTPATPGDITWTCSIGLYTGIVSVE